MKKLLVVGIDRAVAEPGSSSAERQRAYYAGWEVDIVLLATGEAVERELVPGLRVHVTGGANKIVALWRGFVMARKIARERAPEVVSAQDPLWSGLVACHAARSIQAPFHLQDHSGFFARASDSATPSVLRVMAKFLARHARRIRTVSARGARGLAELGISADSIDQIPIATDVNLFLSIAPSSSASNVLCVARLEQEKGVDVLLRVWRKVVDINKDARLRVAGQGGERANLEQLVKELELQGSVELLGQQTIDSLVTQLEWSTLVVQPSWFEGWGLSVIEAAAAGRPVVMTDVGCAGEVIVDGVSGRVVAPGDEEALARAVIDVLSQPEEARRLASAARERVQGLLSPTETVAHIRESFERAAQFRLLVVAQACDADDALFGFFVNWLRQAAGSFGRLTVFALRVGRHDLPGSARVFRLRPQGSRSRLLVVWNLWKLSWRERATYDGVYLRGDYQYPLLAGWLWKLLGKKVILFYAHYTAKPSWLAASAKCSTFVVTSVREACPIPSCIVIGQAIDTERFTPPHEHTSTTPTMLSFGRISPVKRIGWLIRQVAAVSPDVARRILALGTPTTEEAAQDLRAACKDTGATWEERSVTYDDAPQMYRETDIFLNATPGSLDKTIVESTMMNVLTVASTPPYKEMLPEDLQWLCPPDEEFGAAAVRAASLSVEERAKVAGRVREIMLAMHSQAGQVKKLYALFSGGRKGLKALEAGSGD